ncbi:MAG: T9SS type A sorting domain-containing protein [Saprospiraceae bacterium]|nr:T9SS type A sorting domain-containing protein [Saprospiraceae bacterium]
MKNFICVFFITIGISLHAQKHDYVWVVSIANETSIIPFGSSTLDFNSVPVNAYFRPRKLNLGGCSAGMSNANGNLLLYTDGCRICNAQDSIIENGEGLNPGILYNQFCALPSLTGYISGFQSTIILPFPGSDHEYILIHTGIENIPDPVVTKLYYSKIDMSLNNGKGKVTEKNVVIYAGPMGFAEMSAVKHANGIDWWVVKPAPYNKNSYFKFLITQNGPSQPEFQNFTFNTLTFSTQSQTCFSPDGKKFIRYRGSEGVYIFDFDRQTGLLSNPVFIDPPEITIQYGGCAVSPNSRFLYLSDLTDLYQLDLEDVMNPASFRHIATYDGYIDNLAANFGYCQLAPDCQIYISPGNPSKVYHIIHRPDELGEACDFEQHALKMDAYQGSMVPPYPNYRLGPSGMEGLPCAPTVSTFGPLVEQSNLRVAPNPNSGSFTLYYQLEQNQGASFLLYNALGQEVYQTILPGDTGNIAMHLNHLAPGIYFYVVPGGSLPISGRLMIASE